VIGLQQLSFVLASCSSVFITLTGLASVCQSVCPSVPSFF